MNPTGLLLVVLGVFLIARTIASDESGETLAGRLAGGQASKQPIAVASSSSTASTGTTGTATGLSTLTGSALTGASGVGGGGSSSSLLTSDQNTFATQLAAQTGLNLKVVQGWLLGEESSTAAQERQADNNNDWLNIGYTGSGTFGATDSIWSNPVTAATATADWLKGEDSVPGYGTASSGVQGILKTAGQSIAAQIYALQHSGWAGSGYPTLPALVSEVGG